ncbi:MAG: tripartite tricarboxylate transporter substrate binding protein [Achromobacter sp.]|uniref:Bug family tripartite tricarboxylate transporter substrate binding protein n=1 Tax=Achromobacter sp. TaxID=134375 RepID=UPI0012D1F278|nr:tripartite tricarboxylate transporter substrate binding protein [Achromobacter sp.]MPS78576.1 tripartite tricarboxylate transporter substrate binding protein [Achromobacter sp.]
MNARKLEPRPTRRRVLRAALTAAVAAAALPLWHTAHAASTWPTQPIRMVVPFPPGGSVDTVARTLGQALQEELGQPVIIENKPGASSVLGARYVKQAEPDGYTLLLNASLQVANPLLLDTVTYDALKDFAPITEIGAQPQLVLVRKDSPYQSLKDLVAGAKAKPGELTWAIAAYGAAGHLACELVNEQAGVKMEVIPYRGGGPALVDLMGGQVTAMTEPMASAFPHVKDGKLRALAVTSSQRVAAIPDIPTVAEAGYAGFDMPSWYGIWAPAGTPQAVIDKVYAATRQALQNPAVKARFDALSFIPVGSSPTEFAAFQANEYKTYETVIKAIKARGANAAPRT